MSLLLRMELAWRARRYARVLDPGEIAAARACLGPGACAVDVGAHKGGYLYWLQRAVGPTGRVFAFEPQPALAAYLSRAVRALGADHVLVENMGLSDKAGEAILNVPGGRPSCGASLEARPSAGHTGYRVPVTTLDEYLDRRGRPRISLVKCDVEGHELAVFRGARALLARDRPALIFECEARHNGDRPVREVFAYLESLGYRGGFFRTGELRPMAEFTDALQRDPGSRGYVNNFLFRPA